jgi:hypothetical protein
MEIQKMKNLIASVLFACVCVGLVLAASPEARAAGPSDVDTLKQFEQDFGDALVAVDIDKVNQILADDWQTIGTSGRIFTKASVIRDLKSGAAAPIVLKCSKIELATGASRRWERYQRTQSSMVSLWTGAGGKWSLEPLVGS